MCFFWQTSDVFHAPEVFGNHCLETFVPKAREGRKEGRKEGSRPLLCKLGARLQFLSYFKVSYEPNEQLEVYQSCHNL
jgi:hypothetical protein